MNASHDTAGTDDTAPSWRRPGLPASTETGGDTVRSDVDLDHPVAAVWKSLVDSERLSRWMGSGSHIEPWPGGHLRVDDPVTGTPREGRVTRVDEGRRLDLLWWPEREPDHRSEVSFVVAPHPGGTTLTVIETPPTTGSDRIKASACAHSASSWRLATLAVVGVTAGPGPDPTPVPAGSSTACAGA
jgi:uncharacterized protein YndB with AHSA1/START domain